MQSVIEALELAVATSSVADPTGTSPLGAQNIAPKSDTQKNLILLSFGKHSTGFPDDPCDDVTQNISKWINP